MFDKLGQAPGGAGAPRPGSPVTSMGRLIERGGAAIAALKTRMDAVQGAGLAEADQRLRAAEAQAEGTWQRALQGPAAGRVMALGADL